MRALVRGLMEALRWGDPAKDPPPKPLPLSSWDWKFLGMAAEVAKWSKDRSTKVGVVIVDRNHRVRSTGYNGFPAGMDDADEALHQRPAKYMVTEHGERNAIYSAARIGVSTEDCTLYLVTTPDRLGPCADCARAIAQAGIRRVVQAGPLSQREDWKTSCDMARRILADAGVEYVVAD